jgi:hypothetical protein
MAQAAPASDYVSIASLGVAIASLIASVVSAYIARGARKDAGSIAERAHDEWAQQKWFDLYFSANSAYDAMEKLQADSIVQKNGTINIHGGNYPDRANEVIRLFREIQAMAMVFPRCTDIYTLCAAKVGYTFFYVGTGPDRIRTAAGDSSLTSATAVCGDWENYISSIPGNCRSDSTREYRPPFRHESLSRRSKLLAGQIPRGKED